MCGKRGLAVCDCYHFLGLIRDPFYILFVGCCIIGSLLFLFFYSAFEKAVWAVRIRLTQMFLVSRATSSEGSHTVHDVNTSVGCCFIRIPAAPHASARRSKERNACRAMKRWRPLGKPHRPKIDGKLAEKRKECGVTRRWAKTWHNGLGHETFCWYSNQIIRSYPLMHTNIWPASSSNRPICSSVWGNSSQIWIQEVWQNKHKQLPLKFFGYREQLSEYV